MAEEARNNLMSDTTNKRAYAAGTSVGIWQSKQQIERDLQRLSATRHTFFDDLEQHHAAIVFEMSGTRYRLLLPLPDPAETRYQWSPARRIRRTPTQAREAWEQDVRERWRALAEYVKALRIASEAAIIDMREALLPYALLPDGRTVAQYTLPQLAEAAAAERMPPLLPGVTAAPETTTATTATTPKALPAPQIREETEDHEVEGE